MKTYEALEVLLTEKLTGDMMRTVTRENVESLRICPETKQAIIRFKGGKEVLQVYSSATLVPGELDKMLLSHKCDRCGEVFDSSQALGRHKLTHQPEAQAVSQTSNPKRR